MARRLRRFDSDESRSVETVQTYYSEGGKVSTFPHKKLDGLGQVGPGLWQGGKDFVGIEDRYFTAAFLPANGAAPGTARDPLLEIVFGPCK